ncbi:MAG: hypothetical protein Q8906_08355 [Bacillota bacterium]|nr:hypothetical protein [Bacillota bacterium]
MSECKLNHSFEDIKRKFETQCAFLPSEINRAFFDYLNEYLPQEVLNELFHLLKKYDLSSNEEREQRNRKIMKIMTELNE